MTEHRVEVAAVQNSLAHMSMPQHRDFAFDNPKLNDKTPAATNGAPQHATTRPEQPMPSILIIITGYLCRSRLQGAFQE